jgi:hypothetical protein
LRSIAIKFANKTRARMFKKLNSYHFNLMDEIKPEKKSDDFIIEKTNSPTTERWQKLNNLK